MGSFREKYDFLFGNGAYDKLRKCKLTGAYVRVNVSKISVDEFRRFLEKNRVKYELTFIENALFIRKCFFNLSSTLYFHNGMIYFQDLSSQIPVWGILNWMKKREGRLRVLDMAAAPGSKLTQVADFLSFLGKDYTIVALEPNKFRVVKLLNNIQRQNILEVEVIRVRGEDFSSECKFDLIFLDAPCSGSFFMEKGWEKKRTTKDIYERSFVQKRLLKRAATLVKKGGIIVYSTCSLEPEEGEGVVEFGVRKLGLKLFKPFELEKNFVVPKYKKIGNNCYRIMPFNYNTLPFFVSYLRR